MGRLPFAVGTRPGLQVGDGEGVAYIEEGHDKGFGYRGLDSLAADLSTISSMMGIPRCGSMRLKMAKAVDGCWYSLRNEAPGRVSRYSNDRREETDMVKSVSPNC